MATYRILSLDGGGMRGLTTLILLERLERLFPGFLSKIDLFAGTSTGGLLALGLAYGKTPTELRHLYEQQGKDVFCDSLLDNVRNLGILIGALYSLQPLKNALISQFGANLRLRHLPRKVLISTFDLDNAPSVAGTTRTWKAKFFHNFPEAGPDLNEKVVDVALYTAAAPTYFPIYNGYVDGGVVAGNPAMCALAQALHPLTGNRNLDQIRLLSLGTGHNPHFIESLDGDWGLVHWAPRLIDLMLEGGSGLVDYQCRQILGANYLRLNPLLPYPIPMDSVDKIPVLIAVAEQYSLDNAFTWFPQHF